MGTEYGSMFSPCAPARVVVQQERLQAVQGHQGQVPGVLGVVLRARLVEQWIAAEHLLQPVDLHNEADLFFQAVAV